MTYSDPTLTLPDPVEKPEFYAGVPMKRFLAWVFDFILIAFVSALIFVITIVPVALTVLGVFLYPFMFMVIGFFYRWSTLAGGSATWGMRMMAIEIREANGQRLSTGNAFWHTLGYSLSMSMGVVQMVSMIMMMLSERGQGLTDMVLDTAAINRPATRY